jgi:hypothetical protein
VRSANPSASFSSMTTSSTLPITDLITAASLRLPSTTTKPLLRSGHRRHPSTLAFGILLKQYTHSAHAAILSTYSIRPFWTLLFMP